MNAPAPLDPAFEAIDTGAVAGAAVAHDSAELHVAGAAQYTDDLPEPRGMLHVAVGTSPIAHGRLQALDLSAVRAAPGVVDVIGAADVPGVNDVGPIVHDDPIFATHVVEFVGQPLFAVAATACDDARRAARLARLDLEPLPALLTIDDALRAAIVRAAAGSRDARRRRGRARRGAAAAIRQGGVRVARITSTSKGRSRWRFRASTGECRSSPRRSIRARCSTWWRMRWASARMTSWSNAGAWAAASAARKRRCRSIACVAAIIARRTGRAAKLRLDRDDDMRSTGKRHAFQYATTWASTTQGRILALDLTLASRCGFSADLSGPVNDRAVFHCRQRLLAARRRAAQFPLQDQHGVGHRVSRLRRTAGHVRDRACDRRDRARARQDPLDVRYRQSLRRDHAQRHALRHDGRRQHRAAGDRTARGIVELPAAARGDRALESRQPRHQAWHRAHAGEVRHLVHGHALQPGRRAAASVQRRHAAAEPRRHRDGSGPVHQGRAGRRARAGRPAFRGARVGLRYQQGAQRVADGGLVRQRPERHGGARRRAHAARAPRRPSRRASSTATGRRDDRATAR